MMNVSLTNDVSLTTISLLQSPNVIGSLGSRYLHLGLKEVRVHELYYLYEAQVSVRRPFASWTTIWPFRCMMS